MVALDRQFERIGLCAAFTAASEPSPGKCVARGNKNLAMQLGGAEIANMVGGRAGRLTPATAGRNHAATAGPALIAPSSSSASEDCRRCAPGIRS